MAKGILKSIRIPEDILEMIEAQPGESFTAKFENLVRRCVQELPQKERELKGIKEEDLTEEVLWKMAKRVRSGREDGSVGQVKKIYPEDTVKIFKIAMEK